MLDEAKMAWRFASGLRRFLSATLSPGDCRRIVEESVRARESQFLKLIGKAVYGHPQSPYRKLLRWAGVEYGDIERLTVQDGLEGALERLYDAGVHVGLDEFKGRRPIERPGLRIDIETGDFDNPLLAREFEVESSGLSGRRRRAPLDLDLLVHDAAAKFMALQANGAETLPAGVWRAVPPSSSGLKNVLIPAKYGNPAERWFTPVPVRWKPEDLKFALFTAFAVGYGRLLGGVIPAPRYVSLDDPLPVARWLAEKTRQGTPAMLCVSAGPAVKVCSAALDNNLDISGAVLRVGGEPLTGAKAEVMRKAGVSWNSAWAMAECGPLGGACANREAIDEIHLFGGKIAVFQRPKLLADGVSRVDALYLTTLLTKTPKIMLNVDSGDYGVLTQRRCGCLLGELGWDTHLHTIRNYEKLTAAGMHFLGSEIITLVEEVLPSRHGGHTGDYQIVEEEEGAATRVTILVSPRAGPVDEAAVAATAVQFLSSSDAGGRLMARHWKDGHIVRVVRREPFRTATGKTPALRVVRGESGGGSGR